MRDGSLDAGGAVFRGKIRNVLPTNCASIHGREIDASTTAAACLLWEEFGFGAWVPDGLQKATGAVCRRKIRKVLNQNRAAMHGSVIDASSAAAACKPWDEFGLEACVCASSLDIAGALYRRKIRKVLNENRAWMHGREIDTSNEAAACNSWDELGSEDLVLEY